MTDCVQHLFYETTIERKYGERGEKICIVPHFIYSDLVLTEKSIDNTNKFTSYSQFHSALHCAFQVVSMGDFRS